MKELVIIAFAAACQGASSDPGLEADLRLSPGQYAPGEPTLDEGGPAVATVQIPRNTVVAGERGLALHGFTSEDASGAIALLRGDAGHWILPTGLPDAQVPDQLTFDASMSFSPALEPGSAELVVAAVDRDGRHGAPLVLPLTVTAREIPAGELVVSLSWDTEADLDLRVVDPSGVTIWSGDPNSWQPPPPGQPPADPNAWMTGGILDYDSNAQCLIDGRRQENVVWSMPPPAGGYAVFVDTFSLCGEASARWTVQVLRQGGSVGVAEGFAQGSDTRAGTRALDFTVD